MSDPYDFKETKARIKAIEEETLEKLSNGKVTGTLDGDTRKMIEDVNLVIRVQRKLAEEFGEEPTDAEIAERSSLSVERVSEIRTTSKPLIILE